MPRQQSGFVLLLVLFVLLGVGIGGLSQTQGYRAVTTSGFTADQYALQTARQGLLTYAALYPWFYGPRGAGPGHLPCPDTDAETVVAWVSGRDGPDPPCGSDVTAAGQLPRHVNLPGHRYVFHVEPTQRMEYRVSSDMINNPVNRVVNDAVIRGERGQWPYVAWIRQPVDEAGQRQSALLRLPVSREALLPGVRRSVSAWLVGRVNREQDAVCSPSAVSSVASSGPNVSEVLNLIADRKSERLPPSETQPGDSLDLCPEYPPPGMAADDRLIEGVPVAAHWFVRNGWHERVVLRPTESCADGLSGNCTLVLIPPGLRTDTSDERLYFIWQTAS